MRPLPTRVRGGHPAAAVVVVTRSEVLRRRRTVAVVVLSVVLAGLLCVGAQLAAGAGGAEAGPVPGGSAVTVVAPGESLLDVARRAAPGADPSAVVARIRADNALSSSQVAPGRPLVVPSA